MRSHLPLVAFLFPSCVPYGPTLVTRLQVNSSVAALVTAALVAPVPAPLMRACLLLCVIFITMPARLLPLVVLVPSVTVTPPLSIVIAVGVMGVSIALLLAVSRNIPAFAVSIISVPAAKPIAIPLSLPASVSMSITRRVLLIPPTSTAGLLPARPHVVAAFFRDIGVRNYVALALVMHARPAAVDKVGGARAVIGTGMPQAFYDLSLQSALFIRGSRRVHRSLALRTAT